MHWIAQAFDAAYQVHMAVRHFAVDNVVLWTVSWQIAGILGTAFLPAVGREPFNQFVSFMQRAAEKEKPAFDPDKAEQDNEELTR